MKPKLDEGYDIADGFEWCTHSECRLIGLHPAHVVVPRGRPPSKCPECGAMIITKGKIRRCVACPWQREYGKKKRSSDR